GEGGFAVNVHPDYATFPEGGHIYKLSRRFLGIDLGKPLSFASFMRAGIKCVNWLTFLGPRQVEELGGLSDLRAALGERATVYELEGGVMIRAGEAPGFGIVNQRDRLP